jgi:ribosomal protein S17E
MKKRQVVLSEELFDKYQERYFQTYEENKTLQKEIGYFKALFDKEGDTQIIKYNGKLYRITSTTNYVEAGVEETLDFTAVPVREVG